ncbi:MAG: glutathione S-transferase N-terminal domain-containing protein [Alphaproteobacteria bacterium]|nr:glutathione S-transferase N-terminal domain-containing protein [Alphaproteobacteria bacterium]
MGYKLFYYPGNANLAPHFVLEELGVPYELSLVDRTRNQQKDPDYLRLNPNGRIPTLVDGEQVLYEAAAICLHLADRHPQAGLAPDPGTRERGELYKWLMYFTNTVQAEAMIYFYPETRSADESHWPAIKRRAEERLGGWFDNVEAHLAAGGPYVLGASYGIADCFLFMLGRWGRGLQRPPRALPAFGRFLNLVGERPAIRRALEQEGLTQPYF